MVPTAAVTASVGHRPSAPASVGALRRRRSAVAALTTTSASVRISEVRWWIGAMPQPSGIAAAVQARRRRRVRACCNRATHTRHQMNGTIASDS